MERIINEFALEVAKRKVWEEKNYVREKTTKGT